MPDGRVHPADDPRDEGGITVVGPNDKHECCICGCVVGRFQTKHHGSRQYCPSCWDEVQPHISDEECERCEDEFKYNPYVTNLATTEDGEWFHQPRVCNPCCEDLFDEVPEKKKGWD